MFCAFFKQGLCKKGDKCKFSHDPAVEKKSAKRNVYEETHVSNFVIEEWNRLGKIDFLAYRSKNGQEKGENDIVLSKGRYA